MTVPIRLANLTQYERIGLGHEFNLADGHAHQFDDREQCKILDRLPALYAESALLRQHDVETRFQTAFYQLAGQFSAAPKRHTVLCYSASLSIDIIAALLGSRNMSVGLLQPCFDNLPAILRGRGVPLVPVAEEAVTAGRLGRRSRERFDAVFLTLPNNPTGFTLDPPAFERLAQRCAATGTILIVDWTFRFFDRYERWDQYAVLDRCGVSYLCVEDTGKTWPTLDLKCSILAASPDLYPAVAELHNDLLLNVSPFTLRLLTEYVDDASNRGLDTTIRRLIRTNRTVLRQALRDTVLVAGDPDRTISVEWARIASDTVRSLDVVAALGDAGIGALPGDHFYWHDPDVGSRYVRFALARDTSVFAAAAHRLRAVLRGTPRLRWTAAA